MYCVEKKFIFTHPPKCGGTSIAHILRKAIAPNRYENCIPRPGTELKDTKGEPKITSVCNNIHASLTENIEALARKHIVSEDYFKFTIVRNPWDRTVSAFYWLQRRLAFKNHIDNFEDFVRITYQQFKENKTELGLYNPAYLATQKYVEHKEEFLMDYVIKTEQFQQGLSEVMQRLEIEDYDKTIRISHEYRKSDQQEKLSRKELFTKETRDMVGEIAEYDIKMFNYDF